MKLINNKINKRDMFKDCIIRVDFLIKDLTESIIDSNGEINKLIAKAWQTDVQFLIEEGTYNDKDMIYNMDCGEDMILAIKKGLTTIDIFNMVSKRNNNLFQSNYFTYNNVGGVTILTKEEVKKRIENDIENIAYCVLKYPYSETYRRLYTQFIVNTQILPQRD